MIGQTIPDSHRREAERHRRETEANRHLIREIPMGVSGDEHNRVNKTEEMRRRQQRGAARRNGNTRPPERKREFAELIELIYAYGAEQGVVWSEPTKRYFGEAA